MRRLAQARNPYTPPWLSIPGSRFARPGMTEPLFGEPVSPSYSRGARELRRMAQRSIVIGGGAFAGLALGLALRQGLGGVTPIVVADPALALRPSRDGRATAIVAACRRLFA